MALMARSIEMSFSASRLRRTFRSISIGVLLVRALARTRILVLAGKRGQAGELERYPPRAEVGVAEAAVLAIDVDHYPVIVCAGDSSLDGGGSAPGTRFVAGLRSKRSDHQAACGAPPVPRLGQRPVGSRRGHLQGVRRIPHRRHGGGAGGET